LNSQISLNPAAMKELVRYCIEEGFNKGEFSVLDECLHEDFVCCGHRGNPGCNSLAEHKKQISERRTTFEGTKLSINNIVAQGNTVAVRFTMTGRHMAPYLGHAPTSREIERQSAVFFKFRGEKIAESIIVTDINGVLFQIKA
jgi:predicted ester cyclase